MSVIYAAPNQRHIWQSQWQSHGVSGILCVFIVRSYVDPHLVVNRSHLVVDRFPSSSQSRRTTPTPVSRRCRRVSSKHRKQLRCTAILAISSSTLLLGVGSGRPFSTNSWVPVCSCRCGVAQQLSRWYGGTGMFFSALKVCRRVVDDRNIS